MKKKKKCLVHCLVVEKERKEKEILGTSESEVSDANIDDDNVGIGGISRSTFSINGRRCCGGAVHRLNSRLSNDLFLRGNETINRNY